MDKFRLTRLPGGVTCIDDALGDSFYVVEGDNFAAVIDTGISEGMKIMPLIREITEKPPVLLLTHAHVDHMHHMDEFDTVYMSRDELNTPETFLRSMMAGKDLNLKRTDHITTGSVIDLGNRTLEVFQVPGHTPGSLVFYDRQTNYLFTGDAFGSGTDVWMQVPSAVGLREYAQALRGFLVWAISKNATMEFLGGHLGQRYTSRAHPGDNPMSIGVVADLLILTEKVLNGELIGAVFELPANVAPDGALSAKFGRAEMIYAHTKL